MVQSAVVFIFQCADEEFWPEPWPTLERRLPFSLRPYNFQDEASGPQLFAGLDLRLDYAGSWTMAKFRLKNTAQCQDPDGQLARQCKPRCVTIDRELSASPGSTVAEELSYDCEVGFYASNEYQMTPTSGDSYELDILLEESSGEARRGSFLFVMPEITTAMDSLPLLDKTAMEETGAVILHTPGASSSHAKERCEYMTSLQNGGGGEAQKFFPRV